MSMEERLEKAEKLVAEVKAELAAMRATKRNWPERIEAGMVFRLDDGDRYVSLGEQLVNLETGTTWAGREGFDGSEKRFIYEGKLDLTIRTDAHEPTGAELVGRVCEFSDDDFVSYTTRESECHGTGVRGYMTKLGVWWKFARLAR